MEIFKALVVDPSLESRLLRPEVERVTSVNESSVKNCRVAENLFFRLLSALDSEHCKHSHVLYQHCPSWCRIIPVLHLAGYAKTPISIKILELLTLRTAHLLTSADEGDCSK